MADILYITQNGVTDHIGRSQVALTLVPPAAVLTGPGASFPVYIDPEISDNGTQYYAEVSNFNGYTPLRMSQMPDLDISIIANNDPPSGCGEPAVTVVAPAIANAIYNAIGARVRSLPITAEAVKAAMKT